MTLIAQTQTAKLEEAVRKVFSTNGFISSKGVWYELHRDDPKPRLSPNISEVRSIAQYLSRHEKLKLIDKESKTMRKYTYIGSDYE